MIAAVWGAEIRKNLLTGGKISADIGPRIAENERISPDQSKLLQQIADKRVPRDQRGAERRMRRLSF